MTPAERARAKRLMSKYGITPEQYEELVRKAGGVCQVCLRPPKTKPLEVDHCHRTGRIRGVLEHRCNRAIGFFSDPDHLDRAALYFRNADTGLVCPKKKRRKRKQR